MPVTRGSYVIFARIVLYTLLGSPFEFLDFFPRDRVELKALSMQFTIRRAIPEDGPELVDMVKALLIALDDGIEHFHEERFLNDAFGTEPQFHHLVATASGGRLIGYTLYQNSYEPSHAARGVYVIDLYVKDEARGEGVGTALIQAVGRDARERGKEFIWLVTPSDEARKYYDNIMDIRQDVTAYALTGERFETFAEASLTRHRRDNHGEERD